MAIYGVKVPSDDEGLKEGTESLEYMSTEPEVLRQWL